MVHLYELHHESPGYCCTGATLEQHHGYVTWGYVLAVMAMLWLCCVRCYGCCTSQERINASAVPTAPHIFFQLLSLHLARHGFSEQYAQWDTARQLALWARSARERPWQPTPVFLPGEFPWTEKLGGLNPDIEIMNWEMTFKKYMILIAHIWKRLKNLEWMEVWWGFFCLFVVFLKKEWVYHWYVWEVLSFPFWFFNIFTSFDLSH